MLKKFVTAPNLPVARPYRASFILEGYDGVGQGHSGGDGRLNNLPLAVTLATEGGTNNTNRNKSKPKKTVKRANARRRGRQTRARRRDLTRAVRKGGINLQFGGRNLARGANGLRQNVEGNIVRGANGVRQNAEEFARGANGLRQNLGGTNEIRRHKPARIGNGFNVIKTRTKDIGVGVISTVSSLFELQRTAPAAPPIRCQPRTMAGLVSIGGETMTLDSFYSSTVHNRHTDALAGIQRLVDSRAAASRVAAEAAEVTARLQAQAARDEANDARAQAAAARESYTINSSSNSLDLFRVSPVREDALLSEEVEESNEEAEEEQVLEDEEDRHMEYVPSSGDLERIATMVSIKDEIRREAEKAKQRSSFFKMWGRKKENGEQQQQVAQTQVLVPAVDMDEDEKEKESEQVDDGCVKQERLGRESTGDETNYNIGEHDGDLDVKPDADNEEKKTQRKISGGILSLSFWKRNNARASQDRVVSDNSNVLSSSSSSSSEFAEVARVSVPSKSSVEDNNDINNDIDEEEDEEDRRGSEASSLPSTPSKCTQFSMTTSTPVIQEGEEENDDEENKRRPSDFSSGTLSVSSVSSNHLHVSVMSTGLTTEYDNDENTVYEASTLPKTPSITLSRTPPENGASQRSISSSQSTISTIPTDGQSGVYLWRSPEPDLGPQFNIEEENNNNPGRDNGSIVRSVFGSLRRIAVRGVTNVRSGSASLRRSMSEANSMAAIPSPDVTLRRTYVNGTFVNVPL